MGTKLEGDMCYRAAMPDEVMFVLLARDPYAPKLVRKWAHERQAEIALGQRPAEDQAKVDEAMACADRMEAWRIEHDGAWRNGEFKCGEGQLSERDQALEEAAQICEGVTSWGLPPSKLAVANSTQAFCAKAIRAQIGHG